MFRENLSLFKKKDGKTLFHKLITLGAAGRGHNDSHATPNASPLNIRADVTRCCQGLLLSGFILQELRDHGVHVALTLKERSKSSSCSDRKNF